MTTISTVYPKTWITPDEQLARLFSPLNEKVTEAVEEIFPKVLIALTLEYAREPILFLWYEALRKLNLLHIKLPPLSDKILDEPDPFYPGLQIKDTRILYVIPQELRTLHIFEREILKKYAREHLPKGDKSCRIKYAVNISAAFGDESFDATHWELTTPTVVSGSRGIAFPLQKGILNGGGKNDQAPFLQSLIATIYFHKVATGIHLYSKKTPEDESISNDRVTRSKKVSTLTHVQDQYVGRQIMVGLFSTKGLIVTPNFQFGKNRNLGIVGVIHL
jgi:hypothetical protein